MPIKSEFTQVSMNELRAWATQSYNQARKDGFHGTAEAIGFYKKMFEDWQQDGVIHVMIVPLRHHLEHSQAAHDLNQFCDACNEEQFAS